MRLRPGAWFEKNQTLAESQTRQRQTQQNLDWKRAALGPKGSELIHQRPAIIDRRLSAGERAEDQVGCRMWWNVASINVTPAQQGQEVFRHGWGARGPEPGIL
jgi:hypothetical protein